MKIKYILLSLIVFSSLFRSHANNVSKDLAALVAKNFYYQAINSQHPADFNAIKITDTYTITEKGIIYYYIFNIKDGGFVIVSAEDARSPIIAYSFENNYSEENPSPEFTWWMSGYKEQIKSAIENKLTADHKTKEQWMKLSTFNTYKKNTLDNTVGPFITTKWNQGGPFNELCPTDNACGHVLVGCVAVAMGQLLNYYKYPLQGLNQHCYYSAYGNLCSHYGDSTYNWNAMVNKPLSSCIPVASLLYQCGVAVDMMYGCDASGAYSNDVPDALINYFGYSNSAQLEDRDSYNQTQWETMIQQQLNQNRPLYYSGFGTPGGHAFNCDGYKVVGSTTSYHFNWGWGGSSDGWFDINNVNGFNNGQAIIVNSVPGNGYPYNCLGQSILTLYDGVIEDGSGNMDYQPNMNCTWLIAPPPISSGLDHIEITFDRFEITDANDIITIYDGETTSAPILATYKGGSAPNIGDIIRSTSTKVFVTFTTNSTTNGGGWQISYSTKGIVHCSGITTLTNSNYSFDDGSGTYDYNNNTICRWLITPENATYIKLKFNQLETEPNLDFIKIYKGTSAINENLLGTFSGSNVPDTIFCPEGEMCIIFNTNGNTTYPGWSVTYKSNGTSQNISENDIVNNFTIFPNPAENRVKINFTLNTFQNIQLTIIDIMGNKVYTENMTNYIGNYNKLIDISSFAKGLYMIHLKTDGGIFNQKLVIN
jgi:hypothetical protein